MKRRRFLQSLTGVLAMNALSEGLGGDQDPIIMTVAGPIDPKLLGPTLPHEHILVDFVGADQVTPDRYDPAEVARVALPHLRQARELGARSFVECTPAYLGRDPELFLELSNSSGLQVLTNTGYYGAADEKYLPPQVYSESAEQLAARWIGEWRDGLAGRDGQPTGIRPGFIKTAVNPGPLTDMSRKLIHAVALTHRETGLTIASHTGPGVAAMEEIDVLREEGVSPEALIWVHAQAESDMALRLQAAEAGVWVELDGVSADPTVLKQHVDGVLSLREAGLLDRVLLSHDAGWYNVGQPEGGDFRPYDTLFTHLLPALRDAGLSEAEIRRITTDNPREAFTVRRRMLS